MVKFWKLLFLTLWISLFSINAFSQEVEAVSVSESEVEIPAVETETETVPEVEITETEKTDEIPAADIEDKITSEPEIKEEQEIKTPEPEVAVPESEEKTEDERKPMQMKSIEELNQENNNTVIQDFSDLDKDEEHKNPAWFDEIFNSDIPFFNRLDFVFGFEPTMYVNAQSKTMSAPSPIVYPIYFGFNWPNNTFVSFEPSFKFFKTYYCVSQDTVVPAEIENRTVDAYSCMFNVPVVFRFNFWDKFNVKLLGGVGFLIRIPTLAEGVAPDDFGYYGTAQDDFNQIKDWMVLSWRFLYLSGGADCLFKISDTLSLGPEVSFYLPVGAIFSDWSIDGMMVSVGMKVAF